MKHVLLTGAGGFIGSHVLAHILETTDWKVTCLGRSDPGRIPQVLKESPTYHARVVHFTHDLRARWTNLDRQTLSALPFGPVDVIINAASIADVDQSIADPRSVITENVAMMIEVLELARTLKPSTFIHVSTGEVYGAVPMGRPSREWDPILPPNPYSASKAAQEAIAIAYRRCFDVPLIIVNCQNVFGERQQPERFVPKTIARILAGEPVSIYSTNDEPGRRTFTYAGNVADAICFLAGPRQRNLFAFPPRYNVAGEFETDNLTLGRKIANAMGRDLRWELVDTATLRPGHDARYALDGDKLTDLGWMPPLTFDEALAQTVRWTLAHPEWLSTLFTAHHP